MPVWTEDEIMFAVDKKITKDVRSKGKVCLGQWNSTLCVFYYKNWLNSQ